MNSDVLQVVAKRIIVDAVVVSQLQREVQALGTKANLTANNTYVSQKIGSRRDILHSFFEGKGTHRIIKH